MTKIDTSTEAVRRMSIALCHQKGAFRPTISDARTAADTLRALAAERDRLREALKVYAYGCDATETKPCGYYGASCCQTARAALKETGND